MLQHHLDFDMGALKALITPKVVEEVVTEVEAKVATTRGASLKAVSTNDKKSWS